MNLFFIKVFYLKGQEIQLQVIYLGFFFFKQKLVGEKLYYQRKGLGVWFFGEYWKLNWGGGGEIVFFRYFSFVFFKFVIVCLVNFEYFNDCYCKYSREVLYIIFYRIFGW